MIPFNKPYISGKELLYITHAVEQYGHISGNGVFTKKCQAFFEERWGFKKSILTTSCTDALEMAALLLNIEPGDEVIMPSFTFVSTALAFVRQGAVIKFIDSRTDRPGMDEFAIEECITPKTKAIVVVHYAGIACEMDIVMDIAKRHNLFVIEDAAQAIDSFYTPQSLKGDISPINREQILDNSEMVHDVLKSPSGDLGVKKPLGSIGHLGCFSFHETKNIQCGEGGMLCINDEQFIRRAEILWEKGTNRAEFFRGEINKYGWVDTGSSFLPSEINAAFLWAQLEHLDEIQNKRKRIWDTYYSNLQSNTNISLPFVPKDATNNGHMFYLICKSLEQRTKLISALKSSGYSAVFHYQSLHASEYYATKHDGRVLPNSDMYTDCLVRLPLFFEHTLENCEAICSIINKTV